MGDGKPGDGAARLAIAKAPPRRQAALPGLGSARDPIEGFDPFWNHMEGLRVAHVDGHIRAGKLLRVVESADLEDHDARDLRDPAQDVRSTLRTELPRHGRIEIAAREARRLPRRVSEPLVSKPEDQIGPATRYILALSAVALALQDGIARHLVSEIAAITSPF